MGEVPDGLNCEGAVFPVPDLCKTAGKFWSFAQGLSGEGEEHPPVGPCAGSQAGATKGPVENLCRLGAWQEEPLLGAGKCSGTG